MKKPVQPNEEGFWRGSEESNVDLPFPQANEEPWEGQADFLNKLDALESRLREGKHYRTYRGLSMCRLCGNRNGSQTYVFMDWRWPSGFRHYIDAHNVEPTPEFKAFVERSKTTRQNRALK